MLSKKDGQALHDIIQRGRDTPLKDTYETVKKLFPHVCGLGGMLESFVSSPDILVRILGYLLMFRPLYIANKTEKTAPFTRVFLSLMDPPPGNVAETNYIVYLYTQEHLDALFEVNHTFITLFVSHYLCAYYCCC